MLARIPTLCGSDVSRDCAAPCDDESRFALLPQSSDTEAAQHAIAATASPSTADFEHR